MLFCRLPFPHVLYKFPSKHSENSILFKDLLWRAMTKELKNQVKVQVEVEVEAIWKAMAKDLTFVIPRIMPNIVKDVEVIEGDGGLGTVFLFKFGSGVSTIRYQKEKVVDFDESMHQIGLEVVEGGHRDHGFSSYKAVFQLTANGETETLIDVKVVYNFDGEETGMPEKTLNSSIDYIKRLENYLLNQTT